MDTRQYKYQLVKVVAILQRLFVMEANMRRSNGEGTIFKRKDGRWCAAYYDESPKPKRHYVYGRTQTEVKKRLKEKIATQNTPVEMEEKSEETMLLQDWVLYYLMNYKKNEVKETTYNSYINTFSSNINNTELGRTNLDKLTSNQLQSFYNRKKADGYNPKTIRHIYILLNIALNKAVQLKMINENVNLLVTLPKKEEFNAQVLSIDEVKKILTYAREDPLYPIIVLTLYTGLRKGEVMGLKWENIDFEKKELHVKGSLCRVVIERNLEGKSIYGYKILEPKTTKSKRTIPLLPHAIEALEIQRKRQEQDKENYALIYQDEGFVFTRKDGRYLEQRGFMDNYHSFMKSYGVTDVRFHDLRHTFASLLLEAGESPKIIQELLGHSTITTTMDIYAHTTNAGKVKAIGKLDILLE